MLKLQKQGINMKKIESERPTIISKQTGVSLGVLALLLSPLISAVIFLAVANEKIKNLETTVHSIVERNERRDKEINVDKLALTEQRYNREIEKLQLKLDALEASLKLKADAVSVASELKAVALKADLDLRLRDYWTAAQHEKFMAEFAKYNNLKPLEHK